MTRGQSKQHRRDVSRFGLASAALTFLCFVLFLLGTALARDTLNAALGPWSVGIWLLLVVHAVPVGLGIVHMLRANEAGDS